MSIKFHCVIILSILFLLPGVVLYSQVEKGIKLDLGASIIDRGFPPGHISIDERFGFSAKVGFFYNIPINKNISLSSGFDLNLIQSGGENFRNYYDDGGGGIIGFEDYKESIYIGFISLPVALKVQMNKFYLNFGFQGSYNLLSGGEKQSDQTISGNFYSIKLDIESDEFQEFDFGPQIGLEYQWSEKLSLELFYYHGLNDMEARRGDRYTWKIRQLAVGVRYRLNSENK